MATNKSNSPKAAKQPKVRGNVQEQKSKTSTLTLDDRDEEMDMSDDSEVEINTEDEDEDQSTNDEFTDSLDDPFDEQDHLDPDELGVDGDLFGDDVDKRKLLAAEIAASQPLTLVAPKPRKGFEQRWVLYEVNGRPHRKRIQTSRRMGWFPRRGSTIKDKSYSLTKVDGSTESILKINGYVLCEMPIERVKALRKVIANKNERQALAVEQDLLRDGNNNGVPTEYKSRTQTKLGTKRPNVAGNRN